MTIIVDDGEGSNYLGWRSLSVSRTRRRPHSGFCLARIRRPDSGECPRSAMTELTWRMSLPFSSGGRRGGQVTTSVDEDHSGSQSHAIWLNCFRTNDSLSLSGSRSRLMMQTESGNLVDPLMRFRGHKDFARSSKYGFTCQVRLRRLIR